MAPCGYYHDKEGKFVHISCPDHLWKAFREITRIDRLGDEKFSTEQGRIDNASEMNSLIDNWTSAQDGYDIVQALEELQIGAAVVKDYKDIVTDRHAKAVNAFVELDVPYVGKAPYPSVPFRLSESPIDYGRISKMGEDNYEILHRFLGMAHETVDNLTKEGVLYQAEHARWK